MDHAYVGPLGGLVAVRCPASEAITVERPVSYRTTLGGVRKAQVGPRALRALQVSLSFTTPGQVAPFAALVAGEFGPGPWQWVSHWAQVTNLLTPAASTLGAGTWIGSTGAAIGEGGPVGLADGGRAGRSLVADAPLTTTVYWPRRVGQVDDVPVVPGVAVTGSVYASGAGVQVRLFWLGPDRAPLGQVVATSSSGAGALARCAVTGVPPQGAVACYLTVTGASRVTRPAITWTDAVMPWHVGQGMPRVTITALDQTVTHIQALATGGPVSYTVTEVG